MQSVGTPWYKRPEWLLPLIPVLGYFGSKGLWIPPALMAVWWAVLVLFKQENPGLSWRGLWTANPSLWLLGLLAVASTGWSLAPAATGGRAILLLCEILFAVVLLRVAATLPLSRWGGPVAAMLVLAAGAGVVSVVNVATDDGLLFWARRLPLSADEVWVSYSPGGIALVLLFLPAAVVAWRAVWRKTTLITMGIILLTFAANYSGTLRAGLVLSVVAGGLVWCFPVLLRLLAPLAVVGMVAMPFVLHGLAGESAYCLARTTGDSMAHRAVIWTFTAERIAEKPVLGWGMEASKTIPDGKNKVLLPPCVDGHTDGSAPSPVVEQMGLHPHNASLQLWLDFGAVGIVLAALALWRALSAATATIHRRLDGGLLPAVTLMAFLVLNTSFSLWHSWLLGPVIIAAMLTRAALAAPDTGHDAVAVGQSGKGTDSGQSERG